MKRILLIIGFCVVIGRVVAQEVSYWEGQSSNPDPIMRHHEAFMDAFINYMQSRTIQIVGESYIGETDSVKRNSGYEYLKQSVNDESCRIETVSSVTRDGCETLTISIGSGALVHYDYGDIFLGASSSEGTKQIETVLRITYQDECGSNAMTSIHEYQRTIFEKKDNSGKIVSLTDFNYECSYKKKNE